MDINKEREAFEAVTNTYHCIYNADLNYYFSGSKFVGDKAEIEVNAGWKAWQAAKAQAVPEGFVLIKASDRDQEMLELIDQRDHMESQAEELKDKLQALYGVDFGEHSSCNFPFQNAIDYDDSDLVLVPKEPTDKTIARMINTPIEVNLLCDHADIFLSEGEAYIAYQAMIEAQEPAND